MSKVKPAFRPIHWILLAVVILVLAWIHFSKPDGIGGKGLTVQPTNPDLTPTEQKKSENEHKKRLQEEQKARLQARLSIYQSETNRLINAYERALKDKEEAFLDQLPLETAETALKRARDGVDFLASREGLCGWKTCVALAYKMAYDKLKKTNKTEEVLVPLLHQHIEIPLNEAIACYTKALEDFQKEILFERNRLYVNLMAKNGEMKGFMRELTALSPETLTNTNNALDNMKEQFQTLADDTADVTIGVVVEAIFAKATVTTLYRLTLRFMFPIFAKAIARVGATVTSTTIATVIDGPLPIGDIIGGTIAIGGLVWTAADIYKITKILPCEIRDNMNSSIDEVQDDLLSTTHKHVKDLLDTCDTDIDNLRKQLDQTIKTQEAML